MSVTTKQVASCPVSVGCYRRRLAEIDGNLVYTSGKGLFTAGSDIPILTLPFPVLDVLSHDSQLYGITSQGDVHCLTSADRPVNKCAGHSGIFAALESVGSFLAAAHDLSHTVRAIDPSTLTTVHSSCFRGTARGLSSLGELVLGLDDRSIVIFDFRESTSRANSNVLASQPVAIHGVDNKVVISCEDRHLRIYDIRKLNAPIATTKPTTKNGTASLASVDGHEVVCVGNDQSMTYVDISENCGHRDRPKYLSESPWVSSPSLLSGGFSLLTRNGTVHMFDDVISYMKQCFFACPLWDDTIKDFILENCYSFTGEEEFSLAHQKCHQEFCVVVENTLTIYLLDIIGISFDEFQSICMDACARGDSEAIAHQVIAILKQATDFNYFAAKMYAYNVMLDTAVAGSFNANDGDGAFFVTEGVALMQTEASVATKRLNEAEKAVGVQQSKQLDVAREVTDAPIAPSEDAQEEDSMVLQAKLAEEKRRVHESQPEAVEKGRKALKERRDKMVAQQREQCRAEIRRAEEGREAQVVQKEEDPMDALRAALHGRLKGVINQP